jgi:hypothetical protein
MEPKRWTGLLVLLLFLAALRPLHAAGPGEKPFVDQVRDSIRRGVEFLRGAQVVEADGKGHWEVDPASAGRRGGWTSLAMLALLNAGVKPNDPVIERGLKWLRGLEPGEASYTYVVGLQTMVYAAAGKDEDRIRIQRNVDWLVSARLMNGRRLGGWTYGKSEARFNRLDSADNSNTQYALLGLHEGHLAGAKIDREVWESIRDFYLDTQEPDPIDASIAGWGYSPAAHNPILTMTTAGLCGLIISGMELNERRERPNADGSWDKCGEYKENEKIGKALRWVDRRFHFEYPRDAYPAVYYNIYGIERVGRLTGHRFLGSHDWYREGCHFLVERQSREGYWVGEGHDRWRVVSTSFALLFLSKGRTPVLISKLTHGPGDDWNNDRNDARNLVAYASRELFKKQPLAWQVFEPTRAKLENRDDLLALTGELLQSPIVYFNGHEAPEFGQNDRALLKEYVEQGGFILAEACCARKEFDVGFRKLMKELFDDTDLEELPPEHPIWRSYYALVPPPGFKLYGLERGCKTVVVYSPQDLSCVWESNQVESERGQFAFRLGANIIAYATGMELPLPRLTEMEVINPAEEKKIPRGYLKVAQLRHTGDWKPAPHAMRNLMKYLRDKPRLDVALQTEDLSPADEAVLDFKFLYLHGRAEFTYPEKALENLRSDLQTGGILFADACCGKKAFDTAFRAFVAKLFPDKKLEPIPLADELFGKELNGEVIATVRCRREKADGSGPESAYNEVPPLLEGIKIGNRWVVIYSKYDIGCALERAKSSDCLGHDYPSALRLGGAVVLYGLKR